MSKRKSRNETAPANQAKYEGRTNTKRKTGKKK